MSEEKQTGRASEFKEEFILERYKSKEVCDMVGFHWHNTYELYFLLSGTRRYFVGHSIFNVSPGDLMIVPRYELHRTARHTQENYDRILIYFSDEFVTSFYQQVGKEAFDKFLNLGCVQLPRKQQERVRQIFVKMEEERVRQDSYSQFVISQLLYELIVLVLRHGNQKEKNVVGNERKVLQAVRYISDNYDQQITLQDAAQIACMESTYFSKCFKRATGFGFHDYLTQTRLKKAEEFLRTSGLSISEISESCGFSSSNYFGDVFKKYTGFSPRAYRENR